MRLHGLVLFGSLVSAAPSAPIYPRNASEPIDFKSIIPSRNLTWHPCSSFQCAILDVPLDYSKPQGNRALVPLIKYPVKTGPSKGMILMNPGGPGESAIDFLVDAAKITQNITGGHYDMVAWEPRGLGQSIPSANCSGQAAMPKYHQFTIRGNASSTTQGTFLEGVYANSKEIGEKCKTSIGGPTDAGPHMTTKTVVQDMVSILDAYAASPEGKMVESPTLLNYWGFSYGTIVGQTFASMYPDRINRVVMDGVVDAEDYGKASMNTWLVNADAAFTTFFVYCHLAGPSACSYFTGNSTGDIFSRFEKTVARLDADTARKQNWDNATLIDSTLMGLKLLAFHALYSPLSTFNETAGLLVLLERAVQNLTLETLSVLEDSIGEQTKGGASAIAQQISISCSDNGNALYKKTLAEVMPVVNKLKSQSWIGGEPLAKNVVSCTGWGIDGVERYTGPFGGMTKNPMIFVSNTRDPVTPAIK